MIDDDDDNDSLPTTTTNNKQKSTSLDNNNHDDDDDDHKSTTTTIRSLHKMGIDILEPTTKKDLILSRAMDDFSHFVLHDERESCQSIIKKHLSRDDDGNNAGILAGGSDSFEIYRLSITDDDDGAARELLTTFHSSRAGRRYVNVLTMDKLKSYMLAMCERRAVLRGDYRRYSRLGNVMFILSFGPTEGQVRHIDNMLPNLQICCYMSHDCPSTIVYSPEESSPITNSRDLLAFWSGGGGLSASDISPSLLPPLLRTILVEKGDTDLYSAVHTRYFSFWKSINDHLRCFGKLYQPVSRVLSLEATDPGTTLIAGGNDIHAGPKAMVPRMFAFAIGIPEEEDDDDGRGKGRRRQKGRRRSDENDDDNDDDGQNDGEVQYNPVLLHLDLCCILFSMMDFEYSSSSSEPIDARRCEAKRFLLDRLVVLAKEYPRENYSRLLGDDRMAIRDWMGRLVRGLESVRVMEGLMEEAVESESLFYGPDVTSSSSKKKKKKQERRRRRRKKTVMDGRER